MEATSRAPGPAPAGAKRVIVWFRRDLRLADNPALTAALRMAPAVLPVYIWAPEEEGQFQPGRCSRWWLAASLATLDADLRSRGSRLLAFRSADSKALLRQLAAAHGAGAVLFNHLYDPISMVRDNEVKASLAAAGIYCQSFNADTLREPWEMLDSNGKPFTSFDGFWGVHCGLPYPPAPPLPPPATLPPLPAAIEGLPLSELGIMTPEEEMSNAQLGFHWQPGCPTAHRLLEEFIRGGRLRSFDHERAKVDRASTSRLSPHIHYGELSVRHVYAVAKHAEQEWARAGEGGSSVADFLRQLGYREYSRYLSFHFPFTHERSLLEHLRAVPWRFDQRLFKAWRQGSTGYPLVDAAMREVWGTGWMHNRMRVVAASFMVKNLLLPWQWGLKHYWDALLDADLESDALGWQYVSGCMADAHEFSYSIDHATEAKRFDPDGHYVRRWLPVLARLPAKYIHEPWRAPENVLADAGVELGVNYPWPVVSAEESAAALRAANAVVQQCQRRSADAAAAAGATAAAAPVGPFRPATDAEPAEAERLFMENYRHSAMDGSGVVPMVDRAEGSGQSEDVQSNLVLSSDVLGPCLQLPAAAGGGMQVPSASAATNATGALSAAPRVPLLLPQHAAAPAQQQGAASAPEVHSAAAAHVPMVVEVVAALPAQAPQQPQQQQPALISMQGWRQLHTTPIGGSLGAGASGQRGGTPGSNEGTGHATQTGVMSTAPGVVPSQGGGQSGEHVAHTVAAALPPRPQRQTPSPLAPQQQQQEQASAEAALHQGSNSMNGGRAAVGGSAGHEAQLLAEIAAVPEQQRAGHKRQRARSPSPDGGA